MLRLTPSKLVNLLASIVPPLRTVMLERLPPVLVKFVSEDRSIVLSVPSDKNCTGSVEI